MKKCLYFLSCSLILILINTNVRADMDCMDNSFHLNRACGPDYKRYHHVQCDCPCARYRHSFIRGRCEKCLHYRAARPLEIVHYKPIPACAPQKHSCNHTSCNTQ